jgi:hypothetical protein
MLFGGLSPGALSGLVLAGIEFISYNRLLNFKERKISRKLSVYSLLVYYYWE